MTLNQCLQMQTKHLLFVLLIIILLIGSFEEYQLGVENEKAKVEFMENLPKDTLIIETDTLIHYHDGLSNGTNTRY